MFCCAHSWPQTSTPRHIAPRQQFATLSPVLRHMMDPNPVSPELRAPRPGYPVPDGARINQMFSDTEHIRQVL